MGNQWRPERVGQAIQQHLGALFLRGLKDPRVGLVTVTGVKVTADLRDARIFWTVHGDQNVRRQTAAGLEAAKGWLRRELGKELGLRVVPSLTFTYDEAIDRGERIEKLLREVGDEDRRRAQDGPAPAEPPAGGGSGGE